MPDEPYILIPLRRCDGTIRAHAIVDAEDAAQAAFRWNLVGRGYVGRLAPRSEGGYAIRLHREILGLVRGDGLEGDHIDGNPLNCRRENLRIVTHAQNVQNCRARGGTSKYRGVHWSARDRRWVAVGRIAGRAHYLGAFVSEEDAAAAARAWRSEHMTHANELRAVA